MNLTDWTFYGRQIKQFKVLVILPEQSYIMKQRRIRLQWGEGNKNEGG